MVTNTSPRSQADLAYELLPAWSRYVPPNHNPWPKQLAFCMLPHFEALYGGAAGGGKSDALLMAALQYVDVPFYSAIIFRRTLTDLQQSEGLLTRAHEWLGQWPDCKYVPSLHQYQFSSGAKLTFGYMGNFASWEHYQGSAYQFVGFDELTQHADLDYKEMISRMRRIGCPQHGLRIIGGKPAPLPDEPDCLQCQMYGQLSRVPLRLRSTSNPGGRGHIWVKKRFKIHKDKKTGLWVSGVPERPFIPASFLDNPALDQANYGKRLDELDDARKAQLKEGDWDKIATGRYNPDMFREFSYRGGYFSLKSNTGEPEQSFHESKLLLFAVVDVASSVRAGVAGVGFYKNERGPSWTVIGVFGVTPGNNPKLLVMNVERFQEESPYLFPALRRTVADWKPMFVAIDANGPGRPIFQLALEQGIPAKPAMERGDPRVHMDKIANSVEAQNHAKSGKIYLPGESPWVDDFLGELCVWTGHPWDVDDQVDVLSNAGHEYTKICGNQYRDFVLDSHMNELPEVQKWNAQTMLYGEHPDSANSEYFDPPGLGSPFLPPYNDYYSR